MRGQEVYDFSSLDVPASSWDPIAMSFDIAQPADSQVFALHTSHPSETNARPNCVSSPPCLDVPVTRVIPPTPAKVTLAGDLTMNGEGGLSGASVVVGRRSEETNAIMEKQFEFIDGAINELVTLTGIPTPQVLNLFLKSRGRIQNTTNHWNIYGQYFKMYRLQELERAGKNGNVISKAFFLSPLLMVTHTCHSHINRSRRMLQMLPGRLS
jgi:hypothetical protein